MRQKNSIRLECEDVSIIAARAGSFEREVRGEFVGKSKLQTVESPQLLCPISPVVGSQAGNEPPGFCEGNFSKDQIEITLRAVGKSVLDSEQGIPQIARDPPLEPVSESNL